MLAIAGFVPGHLSADCLNADDSESETNLSPAFTAVTRMWYMAVVAPLRFFVDLFLTEGMMVHVYTPIFFGFAVGSWAWILGVRTFPVSYLACLAMSVSIVAFVLSKPIRAQGNLRLALQLFSAIVSASLVLTLDVSF